LGVAPADDPARQGESQSRQRSVSEDEGELPDGQPGHGDIVPDRPVQTESIDDCRRIRLRRTEPGRWPRGGDGSPQALKRISAVTPLC